MRLKYWNHSGVQIESRGFRGWKLGPARSKTWIVSDIKQPLLALLSTTIGGKMGSKLSANMRTEGLPRTSPL